MRVTEVSELERVTQSGVSRALARPLLSSTMVLFPQRLHTPTPDIRAGQRPNESDQHCDEGQNLPAHSRRTSNPPNPVNAFAQVIPVGAGPVKTLVTTNFGAVFCSGAHVEVGVGVKARAEPDRVAAGGP
jgi:hypothetical protein